MLLVAVLWLKCQAGQLAAPMRSTQVTVGLPPLHERPLQSRPEEKPQGGGVPVLLGPVPFTEDLAFSQVLDKQVQFFATCI